MAYELTIDKLYPESRTYRGAAEKFEAYLKGAPEQVGFGIFDDIIAKVVEYFPPQGVDKLIRIRVWRDITPAWATLYKVEVIARSSPIPWAAIAVALGALVLLTLISWNVKSVDWEAAGVPMTLGIGLLILIALLIFWERRK